LQGGEEEGEGLFVVKAPAAEGANVDYIDERKGLSVGGSGNISSRSNSGSDKDEMGVVK
jgi:hypothetical protein